MIEGGRGGRVVGVVAFCFFRERGFLQVGVFGFRERGWVQEM